MMKSIRWLALGGGVLLLLAVIQPADAQRGGRGDRDEDRGRSGFRGGFPGRGGSPGRGGFPDRGGPPGGGRPSFGGGGFSPVDFLRRLDRNGNNVLDVDEMQGPARFMIDRLASRIPQLNTSRPIPLDRLAQAIERARSEGDSGRGEDRGRSGQDSSEIEPLVPGFGLEEMLPPPPGFGSAGELFAVKVVEADRREATERIRRYDANRDGELDRRELSRWRSSDDPLVYDRNGDGRLSASEMAVRYARRRMAEPSSGSDRGGSERRDSRSQGDRGGNDDRMNAIVKSVFERYDRNRSGVIEREEWGNFRTDPSSADRNRDGRLSRDELQAWIASRFSGGSRGGDRGSGERGGGSFRSGFTGRSGFRGGGDSGERGSGREGGFAFRRGSGDRSGDARDEPRGAADADGANDADDTRLGSYRMRTAVEKLPPGLPAWFTRDDANADGQLAMAEFATAWTSQTVADFGQFDQNRDGYVTAQECLKAIEAGAVRGAVAASSGSTFRSTVSTESRRTPPATAEKGDGAEAGGSEGAGSSGDAAEGGEIPAAYLGYSKRLLAKYDSSGDGVLTEDEWKNMSKSPAAADTDGDKKVSIVELARFFMKQ